MAKQMRPLQTGWQSMRRGPLPSAAVLACLALFALICADRYVYLHKSAPGKALLHFCQLAVFLYCPRAH